MKRASEADASCSELYDTIEDTPGLPSEIELAQSLAAAREKRRALQATLAELKEEVGQGRPRLEEAIRRACIVLCTARTELRRKQRQLEEAEGFGSSAADQDCRTKT